MRIRRLVVAGDPPIALDLHPRLSIVTDLGPAGRARFVAAVESLLAGHCDGVSGLVEVAGAEFEIEPDLCEMLELGRPPVGTVLRAADLQRADTDRDTAGDRGTDVERWEARLHELSARRAALLTTRRAELVDELAGLAESERGADQEDERAKAIEAQLEWLGQRLDDLAAERDALQIQLQAVSREVTTAEDDDRDLDNEAAALAARRAEITESGIVPEDSLDSLALADPVPVEAALDAFRFIRSWQPEDLPEAIAIADRLAAFYERKAAAPKTAVPEWLRTQTIQQLEEARAAVAAAEQQQAVPGVDPNRAAALEEAHAAVDEAEDQAARRFGGVLGKRRLAVARTAEQAILDELGYASYASFMMGRAGGSAADPDAERRLADARAALADAEAVWQEIEGQGGQADFAWPVTDAEEEALRTQAAALLGPVVAETASHPDRLITLLREYRTPVPDWQPAGAALIKALGAARVDVSVWPDASELGEEEAERLETATESWLADARQQLEATRTVERQLRQLDTADAFLARRRQLRVRDREAARAARRRAADAAEAELETLAGDRASLEAELASLTDELAALRPVPTTEADDREAALAAEAERVGLARAEAERELAFIDRHLDDLAGRVEARHDEPSLPDPAESSQLAIEAELIALDGEAAAVAGEIAGQPSAPGTGDAGRVVDVIRQHLAVAVAVNMDGPTEAGALPLVLDNALDGQPPLVVEQAMALLAEQSAGVQVVVVTDDDAIAAWANGLPDGAAAVVSATTPG